MRSTQLAVGLISLLVLALTAGAFIPQNITAEFYSRHYPASASLILFLQLDHLFTSLPFFLLCALLAVNITFCSGSRILLEFSGKIKKRFGPDLIHLSLLLFLTAGLYGYFTSSAGFVFLKTGESAGLPDEYIIYVRNIQTLYYPDGNVKDYVTDVSIIFKDTVRNQTLKVNSPLQAGDITLYQSSIAEIPSVVLKTEEGSIITLEKNEIVQSGTLSYIFSGTAEGGRTAQFHFFNGNEFIRTTNLSITDSILFPDEKENHTIFVQDILFQVKTGIRAVRDTGRPIVFSGIIILALGLALTFFQKITDIYRK